jgi:hypothetical protein
MARPSGERRAGRRVWQGHSALMRRNRRRGTGARRSRGEDRGEEDEGVGARAHARTPFRKWRGAVGREDWVREPEGQRNRTATDRTYLPCSGRAPLTPPPPTPHAVAGIARDHVNVDLGNRLAPRLLAAPGLASAWEETGHGQSRRPREPPSGVARPSFTRSGHHSRPSVTHHGPSGPCQVVRPPASVDPGLDLTV